MVMIMVQWRLVINSRQILPFFLINTYIRANPQHTQTFPRAFSGRFSKNCCLTATKAEKNTGWNERKSVKNEKKEWHAVLCSSSAPESSFATLSSVTWQLCYTQPRKPDTHTNTHTNTSKCPRLSACTHEFTPRWAQRARTINDQTMLPLFSWHEFNAMGKHLTETVLILQQNSCGYFDVVLCWLAICLYKDLFKTCH